MTSSYELLKFHVNPGHWREMGKNLVSEATQARLKDAVAVLQDIQKQSNDMPAELSDQGIQMTYRRFMQAYHHHREALPHFFASQQQRRRLSHALTYAPTRERAIAAQPEALALALDFLTQYWSVHLAHGLLQGLLQSWPDEARQMFQYYLARIQPDHWPSHIAAALPFVLDADGARTWAQQMLAQAVPLHKASEALGFRAYFCSAPYFSAVARHWLQLQLPQTHWSQLLDPIVHWLQQTAENKVLARRLLVPLILACDQEPGALGTDKQAELHELSDLRIGVPEKQINWQVSDPDEPEEQEKTEQARQIVESWIKQLFIRLFFTKLSEKNDPERMHFWNQYLQKIEAFKIYGPQQSWINLMCEPQLKAYVPEHWGNLEGDKNQHIFVMQIGTYLLIEFGGKGGAFYAIQKKSPDCPDLRYKNLHISAFRPKRLHSTTLWPNHSDFNAVSYSEGRLTHRGDWQNRISMWLEKYVLHV